MADIVPEKKRSEMMAGIRGKDTKPELRVRRLLFASGYRYRLHRKDLPGTPDIVLPGRRVAIFVHGCFWHWHQACALAKIPSTRPDFWEKKLTGNRARDALAIQSLRATGWRVLVIWECFIRGCKSDDDLKMQMARWIEGNTGLGELRSSALE